MPVSTSTCLKPPPAATISRMPAMGGRASLTDLVMASLFMPEARPKVNIATNTEISSAMNGLPITSKTFCTPFSGSSTMMSTIALAIISATGSSTVASVLPNEGRVSTALSSRPSNRCGGGTSTQRPASRPNSGPETITVGMATSTPSISVVPRFGAQGVDREERTGVGRHQTVHRREAGEGGDADGDHGQLGAPGHQVDDRHQQHQADLEEHRQADERADAGHRPRQHPGRGAAHDGVDDLVGTARVGEQLGEHRAEGDQGADARGRRTEAGGEAGDDVVDVLPGDDADGQAAEDQRQERVHLGAR